MIASSYSAQRADLARAMGLGKLRLNLRLRRSRRNSRDVLRFLDLGDGALRGSARDLLLDQQAHAGIARAAR